MVLLIILLTFFFTSSVQADEYFPYQNNPVVVKTQDSYGITQPAVLHDNGLFSIWFSDGVPGGTRISTMKSANGIDWYDKKILDSSSKKSQMDPFMFKKNNEYQLYFSSAINGPISIWRTRSADGITYEPNSDVQVLAPENEWEHFSVSCPSLIEDNGRDYLFYAGAGPRVWAVGMAISDDGLTWKKCANNPIAPEGAGPQVVKYNNIFYLFYHSSLGVQVQQADALNGCDTVWTNRHVISLAVNDPSPIVVGNNLWIYGNTTSQGSPAIALGGLKAISPPFYPIVIIPGMFASWNKDALLHNAAVVPSSWKLNPAVSEYDALQQTLEKIGRTKNTDYFLFAYDWRKPVEETTQNLDTFIAQEIWKDRPLQPVQIVGHSLGGVVSRVYADQNPTKPIKKIVSAGSPHLGIAQAYKPLVAGEIDRENTLMWLAEKLVLLLNKSTIQSDKDTIIQRLPVLFDLLPSFSFLKDAKGNVIDSQISNDLFSRFPIEPSPRILQTYLGGTGIQTLKGYIVGERTAQDKLFDLYSDGHPLSSFTQDGDGVILATSSLNKLTPPLQKNHGEMIYAKESVQAILSAFDIPIQPSDIAVGKPTNIFPAILTFIQSPATMSINYKGTTTLESDGMIYLQNVENAPYTLQVTGESTGEYTVSMWLIGDDTDKWIQFHKPTSQGKVDTFTIAFDSSIGGSVQEQVTPTNAPTPTTTTSPIPASTSTPIPSSPTSHSDNSSSPDTNSSSSPTAQNISKPPPSTSLFSKNEEIDYVPSSDAHETTQPKKEERSQILGIADIKQKQYTFPLGLLLFLKQISFGIYASILLLITKGKKYFIINLKD